jgi:hypothetical protein
VPIVLAITARRNCLRWSMVGEWLMPELVKLLDGPAVSYGKGALVGVNGEMDHGGRMRPPDAEQADAGRGRRWQGRDIL